MGFFDDIVDGFVRPVVDVVGGVTRLTARGVAAALSIPIALAEAALDEGCETLEDVLDFIQGE